MKKCEICFEFQYFQFYFVSSKKEKKKYKNNQIFSLNIFFRRSFYSDGVGKCTREGMDLLWKKETRHEDALYVDIFRKLNPELRQFFGCHSKPYYEMAEHILDSCVRDEKDDAQSIVYRKKGDELFRQSEWQAAIKYYNQSLCFGEIGSAQIAIGYINRAQCFYQLKMYENCLVDLDLVRYSNFPRQQVALLALRETECMKLIADGAESSMLIVPKLSFAPNEKYSEMANVLDIVRGGDGEWHIVAKEDINVGKIVMVEKHFISTYNDSYRKCCICCKSLTNLVPCNKCSNVLMCPKCSGSILHQVECDAQVLFHDHYPLASDTFRSILLAMTIFEHADELMDFVDPIVRDDLTKLPNSISNQKTKYRGFLQLAHNAIDLKEDIMMVFTNYSSLLAHEVVNLYFNTETHRRFLMHLVFQHYSALKFHNVSTTIDSFDNIIEETEFNFILGSNFEHSCAPHLTMRIFDGYGVFITVRPINKGQSLKLSFNEAIVTSDFETRQNELLDEFGYKCDCERCQLEDDTCDELFDDEQTTSDPEFQFIIRKLDIKNDSIDNDDKDGVTKRAEHLLNKYGFKKWNKCLDLIFICFYCAMKKKYNQYGNCGQKDIRNK